MAFGLMVPILEQLVDAVVHQFLSLHDSLWFCPPAHFAGNLAAHFAANQEQHQAAAVGPSDSCADYFFIYQYMGASEQVHGACNEACIAALHAWDIFLLCHLPSLPSSFFAFPSLPLRVAHTTCTLSLLYV